MKTVFDKDTRDELIVRVNALGENSTAQWGKMNVYQMLRHCILWQEWMADTKKNKQPLVGLLFGKMALRSIMKDESPLTRNTPTLQELKIKETSGDIAAEKRKLTALIEADANFSNPGFVHTFFGKMTKEEIGYMKYKHLDHHLRQFNA